MPHGPCVVRASGILLQAVASGSGLSWLLWAVARVRCSSPLAKSVCTNVHHLSTIYCTNVLKWVIKKSRHEFRRDGGPVSGRKKPLRGGALLAYQKRPGPSPRLVRRRATVSFHRHLASVRGFPDVRLNGNNLFPILGLSQRTHLLFAPVASAITALEQ